MTLLGHPCQYWVLLKKKRTGWTGGKHLIFVCLCLFKLLMKLIFCEFFFPLKLISFFCKSDVHAPFPLIFWHVTTPLPPWFLCTVYILNEVTLCPSYLSKILFQYFNYIFCSVCNFCYYFKLTEKLYKELPHILN